MKDHSTRAADHPPDIKKLTRIVLLRGFIIVIVMGSMFFLPAGTILYWQAWLWMAILFIPASLVITHYVKTDPELLERRMRLKEKERTQRTIIKLSYPLFAVCFLIPGFDQRYGWSSVPPETVLIADGVILVGYLLFVRVLKENRYASRTIEVEEGQKVITTGPYSIVRHPMYVGALMIYVFSPLALASYWAMIISVLLIVILVARILNEEKVLTKELDGYVEYTRKTKYRLIPGVW